MEKSFYDFDYIIELGEKRVEQYTAAYQLVLGRLTNIILISSALGIYLVPVIQDIGQIRSVIFNCGLAFFLLLVIFSIIYTFRLLIPVEVAYFRMSSLYYQDLRLEYEGTRLKPEMSEMEKESIRQEVNHLLKASYINELILAQATTGISISREKGKAFKNQG